MKFTELKDSIKGGAQSVYLLQGDDAYFRMKGEQMIKDAFLRMPELNFAAFDGETLKGGGYTELVSALKNYPFMAEKRLVKVSEMYPSESEFQTYLQPLFDDFPPDSILIIVNSGGKKGVDMKRKKIVAFVDCDKSDRETVARWIYATLKRAGIAAGVGICESIADWCLCDMARVSVETQKIIDYKVSGELTREEAETLIYKDAEYRLYELTNTVPRRDFSAFSVICAEIMKKGGDEMMIMNALFNYFRNLYTMATSDKSDKSLADMLKMKEYGVKKSREQARAIGVKKLTRYINCIYGCISDVKCGLMSPPAAYSYVKNEIFFAE